MSAEAGKPGTNAFVDAEQFKFAFRIDGTRHDDALRHICERANTEAYDDLKGYLPGVKDPQVTDGTVAFRRLQAGAMYLARALWFESLHQQEKAEMNRKWYGERLEKAALSLRADLNVRTSTVMVSADPRLAKLLVPAQKETFILDTFY